MSPRPTGPGATCAAALVAIALAPAPAGADDGLVELLLPVVDLEVARIPDTDVLCAAGGVVRFRLAREARVSLSVAGQPARGSVDGTVAAGPLSLLPLRPGVHEIVVGAERRKGLATGERPFTLTALEPGARPTAASGTLRDERIDRAVMRVGRTFVSGVDLFDGHLVLQAKDLDIEGRHLSLELTRTYASGGRSAAGLVGAGWRLNYESSVTPLPECGLALVRTADGGTQAFVAAPGPGGPDYRPQRGYHTQLLRNPDGSFDFVDKSASRHHFAERAAGTAASLRLAWIEEPHGDRIALAYDAAGRLREVSEWHPGLGPVRTLLFRHAAEGGASRIVSARAWGLGLGVDFRYDASGNLVAVTRTDRETGVTIDRYAYSASNPRDPHRLLASTPSGEGTTKYAYAEAAGTGTGGPATSVSPPGAAATHFLYDASQAAPGHLRVEVRTGDGPPTRYVLNRDGNPLEIDEPGQPRRTVTRFTWDAAHVVKKTEDGSGGRHLEYGYDDSGNLTLELDSAGKGSPAKRTAYAYDSRFNKLVHKEDPEGQRSAWTIDPHTGDLLRAELPGGKVTTWAYDREGCLSEERDGGRRTLYRRPDTFCNATEIHAPDGGLSRKRYDPRGRLLDETKTPAR